ncbi:TQO small subunit DoxD [Chitinophaga flava]|uniref:DoxX protein n=1 Tax=Chitinophaga flava TaxID=2259036 RepID=A0A365XYC6_9BACT|nr:TQO small subunit DoxD [Chitinophaga flava]RBL91376.1 DoxX protein [Chitinophaga flava]
MRSYQDLAALLLRLALGAGFLSAVASRLSLWGKYSSGWGNFLQYTAQVNTFAPKSLIPAIAITSTILETLLGLLLLLGYQTAITSFGAAILTLLFAAAMTYSSGIKEPLDYSVLAFSAGAFLLSTLPAHRWSIDQYLK